ncbi:MAG: hypothetical protein AAGI38_02860 [Bacteroidota bacterium]
MKQPYDLEVLKKIQQVEAPPHLLERVEASIHEMEELVSTPRIWLAAAAVLLLLLLNAWLVTAPNSHPIQESVASELVESLDMSLTNQFYSE